MRQTLKRVISVLTVAMLLSSGVQCAAAAEHTHSYTAVTVVEPGYIYGGYTVYRCVCGDSYRDDPTSPLPQPICVMEKMAVAPGETFTVRAVLQNCSGLENLILDLMFNEYDLRLDGVECAEYGMPTFLSDKALYFDTIDPTVQKAVLLLTFTVREDAPTGPVTFSVSGCGTSGCAADNGEEISLTAQSVSLTVFRPFGLHVQAPGESVLSGDTVQMTVDLSDNPGIAGMKFDLHYDTQVLTLTGVEKCGMFEAGSFITSGDLSMMPLCVLWDDATAAAGHTDSGTVLTLTFTVKDTVPDCTTRVSLTFDPYDMMDMQLEPVASATYDAELTILHHTPGDADGDGEVDLMDVTLLSRYLAHGWEADVRAGNCDVNRDGAVNLKDVVLIRRFLANWDITLR